MTPLNTSVLLIYTGGTIGMIENTATGALENFNFEQLQRHIPELQKFNFPIDTYQFDPPMDSSDMEPDMWRKLVHIIHENYDLYHGFVILHGTDTMAYTASALSFMLEGLDKPVILTGSQLPIGVLRTDGKENLMTSIEIAAAQDKEGKALVPEVCIFFENHLMRGNRTTKMNAENFNAFRSFNYPVLAEAGIHIKYNQAQIHVNKSKQELVPHYLLDTNIVVLKLFHKHSGECNSYDVRDQRIKSGRTRNVWFRQCSPKGMVYPQALSGQCAGDCHCQCNPVQCRNGGDGTLRNGVPAATGRSGLRI